VSRPLQSLLKLDGLSLSVALGWTEPERSVLQEVNVDIEIGFFKLPTACQSDELGHTLCYDQLAQKINKMVIRKPFKLLEFLTHEVFNLVCACVNDQDAVQVTITKNPPMDNLMRASFTLKR
jgi:dihydroneopterin aldolase